MPSKAGGGGGGLLHGHAAQVHDLAQDLSGGIALLSGSLHVALLAIQDPHDPVHPGLLNQRILRAGSISGIARLFVAYLQFRHARSCEGPLVQPVCGCACIVQSGWVMKNIVIIIIIIIVIGSPRHCRIFAPLFCQGILRNPFANICV